MDCCQEYNCHSCGRPFPAQAMKELVPPGGVWYCAECEQKMLEAGQARASVTLNVECVSPDGTVAWTDRTVV